MNNLNIAIYNILSYHSAFIFFATSKMQMISYFVYSNLLNYHVDIHDGEMWPLLNIIEKPSQALFFFMQTFIDMSNKSCFCTPFTHMHIPWSEVMECFTAISTFAIIWCYLKYSSDS